MKAIYRKQFLPNYGVFDEDRYQPGRDLVLLRWAATRSSGPRSARTSGSLGRRRPTSRLAGAHVVANISASPFHIGKGAEREEMLATRARDNSCWIVLVNAVGAQDELIFDGQSPVLDENGEVVVRAGLRGGCCWSTSTRPPQWPAAPATRGAAARARAETCPRPRSSMPLGDPVAGGGLRPVVAEPVGKLEEMRSPSKPRPARLRSEERFHGRRPRHLGVGSTRR